METHTPLLRHAPNALTALRVAVAPFLVLSLLGRGAGSGAVPLGLFVFAAASDYLDGRLARRFGAQSRLGEFLDPLADKILTGSAFVSFALLPELGVPFWLVLLILAREAVLTLARLAGLRGGTPLRTERAGKAKTAVQMAAIAVILLLLSAGKCRAFQGLAACAVGRLRLPLVLVSASAAAAVASMTVYLLKYRFDPGVRRAGEKAFRGAALAVSTGCFIGFIPKAPGTIASLAGVAVWGFCPPGPAYYLLCGFVLVLAFFAAEYAEKRLFDEKDPPRVVIDEIAGALVTFLTFSFSPSLQGLLTCAIGFLLFRFLDILKPSPVGLLQRLPGGAGIVLDDLAAGMLANAGLQLFRFATSLYA